MLDTTLGDTDRRKLVGEGGKELVYSYALFNGANYLSLEGAVPGEVYIMGIS